MTVFFHTDLSVSKHDDPKKTLLPLSENSDPSPWDSTQRANQHTSKLAADILHARLSNLKDGSKIRIQGAQISLLSGANMPAVLVEIGYLSNPIEEKKLQDKKYLLNLAEEICIGVNDFFQK